MEKPAAFNLNEAIRQWRENLGASPVLGGGDVEELETHLRDSVSNLQARGLSLEEAFLVACQRLGKPPELQQEYKKLNGRRLWMDRAVWILLGVLALSWLNWMGNIGMIIASAFVMQLTDSGHGIGLSCLLSRWFVMALVILGCYGLWQRWHEPIRRLATLCVRRPFVPVLLIILINFSWQPIGQRLASWTSSGCIGLDFSLPAETVRLINQWIGSDQFLWIMGVSGSFLLLLRHYWCSSDGLTCSTEMNVANSWPAVHQEQLSPLQSLGLSMAEAALVVKVRQGHYSSVVNLAGPGKSASVWTGRSLWMIGGVILNDVFFSNLSILMERPFFLLSAWWPQFNGCYGFLLVLSYWLLFGGMMALFWRTMIRPKPLLISRFAQWAVRHLVWGTLALSALWLGIQSFISLPFAFMNRPTPSPDFYQWSIAGYQILHYVLLVMLFFWLARRSTNWQSYRCHNRSVMPS